MVGSSDDTSDEGADDGLDDVVWSDVEDEVGAGLGLRSEVVGVTVLVVAAPVSFDDDCWGLEGLELDEGSASEEDAAEDEVEAPAPPADELGSTPKSSAEDPGGTCCLFSMARYMCAGRLWGTWT